MTTVHVFRSSREQFLAPAEDFRIFWRMETDSTEPQTAAEVEISETEEFAEIGRHLHVVGPDQTLIVPGELVEPRKRGFIRVRAQTSDQWSAWSQPIGFEGALGPDDWVASWITLPNDLGVIEQAPSPLLRKLFRVDGDIADARLHVTALGVYRLVINGTPVTDEILSPGWTSYHKRVLTATYDVSHLLDTGENVIGAALGDGWYRGRLGWDPDDSRGRYGREVALLAQLEVITSDGSITRVVSNDTWTGTTGPVRRADFYDGCLIDLRSARPGWDRPGFDDTDWEGVKIVGQGSTHISQRVAEPVKEIGSWEVEPSAHQDGTVLLDGGQNIAGHVSLKVKGEPGTEVVVRHAEVLNPDGSLHTLSLRSAEAKDRYILAESGEAQLQPEFTFHGFRYATVETTAEILEARFVPISSDLERRGWFECSHDGLNRLHENVVWSLRDNFVAIPTDCPQRDERLGWTGDAQAFAPTAATLVHGLEFWRSWLEDLALDQDPDLGPPSVVPDVVLDGPLRYGRAGWADAATLVPWALYESYGDVDVLRDQFDSMRSWVDSLSQRAGADGLLPESPQFGDWLDPDAPGDKPWQAKVDSTFIANAFFSRSARIVSETARIIGQDAEVADRYAGMAQHVAAAAWDRWATHLATSQSGCAIALELDVVPPHERLRIAETLAGMVRSSGGRVSTGFLGTPLVLPALASEGFYAEAYAMLLCRDMPSWLYQVDRGATTTWERWDAIRPDGTIHPGVMSPPPGTEEGGQMLSFNHYAYGSVIDWVYRHLGGVAPVPNDPGYRSIILRPRPPRAVDWAKTSIETAYGKARMSWSLQSDDLFEAEIELPFGTRASFDGPLGDESIQYLNGERRSAGVLDVGPGAHRVQIENASPVEPI